MNAEEINYIYSKVLSIIDENSFKGWDPYDIFNSKYIHHPPTNKKIGIILTQINRISNLNFRNLMRIPKTHNSKAMALLLSALLNNGYDKNSKHINLIKNWLITYKSTSFRNNYTIGFTFSIMLDGYTSKTGFPSLIITLFTMYAFIDFYLVTNDTEVLNALLSFQELLEIEWPHFESSNTLWYSYNIEKINEIYNATAKVGKFFALLVLKDIHHSPRIIDNINKILNYLSMNQRSDGSWPYCPNSYTDGFHTAFILDAIMYMRQVVDNPGFKRMFNNGIHHYKNFLFKENGQPLYFHPKYKPADIRRYLIETDIRDCSMAIIFFSQLQDRPMAEKILKWTLSNMFNFEEGYFYYYKNKYWTNKVQYIRWQAWTIHALSVFKKQFF